MINNNPLIVFVGDQKKSERFAAASNMKVFGASSLRDALGQTIFSYPDAIVIDAADDMLRAEDSFFHLRTINHPPLVILSDVPGRWDTRKRGVVHILPEDSSPTDIANFIRSILRGSLTTSL